MFYVTYVIALFAWILGYLPISGWWFIIIPIVLPIIIMMLGFLVMMGFLSGMTGLLYMLPFFEEMLDKIDNKIEGRVSKK
jgi:hypothetical protein